MVEIPAGEFILGSDQGGFNEKPAHAANLGTYWIDRYEVTYKQYMQFVEATGHRQPGPPSRYARKLGLLRGLISRSPMCHGAMRMTIVNGKASVFLPNKNGKKPCEARMGALGRGERAWQAILQISRERLTGFWCRLLLGRFPLIEVYSGYTTVQVMSWNGRMIGMLRVCTFKKKQFRK